MLWWLMACESAPTPQVPSPAPAPEPVPEPAPPDEPPEDTAIPASTLYPPAPYDCSAGIPEGEPAVRSISGVQTTEGLAFDLEGYLVTEQHTSSGALVRWSYEGEPQLFAPGIGSARGLNLLGNGDVLIASGMQPELWAVEASTGTNYLVISLPAPGAPAGARAPGEADVASDGSLAVGTLYGMAFVITPDGAVHDVGRVGEWGTGAAFSADESRAYFGRWDIGSPEIWVSERDGATWGEITPWATVPSYGGLSGLAVDACEHVYVVNERCVVYRVTPEGQSSVLVDLREHFTTHLDDACRTLAFGRGLGGWDAYALYASTYDEVLEIDVGVPGRPR